MSQGASIPGGSAVSLFAGAGGLDIGCEAAGFSTRAVVEVDEVARRTLSENRDRYFPELSDAAVPMADRVAAELERHFQRSRYQGDEDLVFCHPETGRPYDASKSRKRFKDVIAAAQLRPIRFHDLRHTFGTGMAAAGAPLRAIQEWMGHRDIQTTQVYADYAPDPSQGAVWAQAAFGVATNLATNLSESGDTSEQVKPHGNAGSQVDAPG